MVKLSTLSIFFLLGSAISYGQNIYVCNGLRENGIPIDSKSEFHFENFSACNLIAYRGSSDGNLMLSISEKQDDNTYSPTEAYSLTKDNSSGYYITDVTWFRDGKYLLSVYSNQQLLASDSVLIDVNEDDAIENSFLYSEDTSYPSSNYSDPSSTFYFMDSKVEFCSQFDDAGLPISKNEFNTGETVNVFVTNGPKKFKHNFLIIYIYKKKGKNYDKLVFKETYSVDPEAESYTFSHSFASNGNYLVSVVTGDNIWVNDGYLTIKK
ncbi:MAG TPA: hypothetical protein DCQ93_02575 [Bacteroidetes bacterium]|nr:hypothetical protein [Bacteroidota bacterium]